MVKLQRLDGDAPVLILGNLYRIILRERSVIMRVESNNYNRSSNFFMNSFSEDNGWIFKELGIDKHAYFYEILGYSTHGDWPELRTIDDLNKVVRQLSTQYGVIVENATGGRQ